jgi:TetR/AcrR family transcriptional repressor of nem operon
VSTREALVERAIGIVRRAGYAGFSYADLSDAIGIRKASIHHHFPTKEDLGLAMVERYRRDFARELASIERHRTHAVQRLAAYAGLYRAGLERGSGCLCGVLALEISLLPTSVADGVRAFFDENEKWLEHVLAQGRRTGELRRLRHPTAAQQAHVILAALQGAMVMARAREDIEIFDEAARGLMATMGDWCVSGRRDERKDGQ